MNWTVNLVSVAVYVLQAIGLYTIAKRRGIRHAWLAWVPVGFVWILGSISDDFKARLTGKLRNKRKVLLVLTVVLWVLSFLTLNITATMIFKLFTPQEVKELAELAAEVGTDMYSMTEAEYEEYLFQQVEQRVEKRMTDSLLAELVQDVMNLLLLGLGCLVVGIWAAVLEWMSVLDLYESTEPAKKTLYFLLGLFLGIQGIFIFLCRDKDALPAALPPQEPLQN